MPPSSLPGLKTIESIVPFVLIMICAISAKFMGSEVLILLVFLLVLGIYVWRKYDPRILLATALFLLTASIPILVVGSETESNKVAIWAFYFLVISIIGFCVEHVRKGYKS